MDKDTIYRQAAIDALDVGAEVLRRVLDETDVVGVERAKYEWGLGLIESHIADVNDLPSAEPEIIRCKDCKWYGRADKRRFYRGMDCLQKRIDTIVPDKDFCSRAERRTDE